MKFDVYGRFALDIIRADGQWRAYRLGDGTRRLDPEIVIPDHVEDGQLEQYLDDLLHELGRPGSAIRRVGSDLPSG